MEAGASRARCGIPGRPHGNAATDLGGWYRARVELAFLWLSVVALIVGLRPYSKASTWWLAPYLARVTFAAFLDAAIVRLNPGA